MNVRPHNSLLLWSLALALVATIATGCRQNQASQPAAAAPPPPEVIVTLPVTEEVTNYEDFTGRTVALKTIDLRARVTGYLDKVNFTEGVEVKQGDLLYEIDPRPYQAAFERSESNVTQAQAKLARLEADLRRASNLIKSNSKAISREEYDRAVGDRDEGEAALGVAKADLELAKLNLSYCKIHAPISGMPSRSRMDPGNLVQADDSVLTTLVSLDPMYAYFDIDERTLLKVRRDAQESHSGSMDRRSVKVTMGLVDEVGYPHEGKIDFFDNQVDSSSGTLVVRGVFDNKDRLLTPGLFVRVRLPLGEPYRAITVEEQALATDQENKYLYVVDKDNKVEYRLVKVGKLQKKRREIRDGLAAGERVVVSGLQRLRPGLTVDAKLAETTASRDTEDSGSTRVQ